MRLQVNGQWKDLAAPLTVAGLLELLALHPRRVAVERNERIVPRARYGDTQLGEDDRLEIVTLVGGG